VLVNAAGDICCYASVERTIVTPDNIHVPHGLSLVDVVLIFIFIGLRQDTLPGAQGSLVVALHLQ
jgi:hypothetical protein